MRNISRKSRSIVKEFTDSIMEMDEVGNINDEVTKLNNDIKKIVDLDGNLQETYDMSDIMPEIEKAKEQKTLNAEEIKGQGKIETPPNSQT